MTLSNLLDRLRKVHGEAEMQGWDFSILDGRPESNNPPWDFEADCLDKLRTARRVLDLGTGGGERVLRLLSQLGDGPRPHLMATEGWAPNVPIARKNLATIGVELVEYDADAGDRLPFDDNSLDLVMSRHETLDAAEVARGSSCATGSAASSSTRKRVWTWSERLSREPGLPPT